MTESESCKTLRSGLKAIRLELEEILVTLSTDEADAVNGQEDQQKSGEAKEDFFDQIIHGDHLPEGDELYRKVLKLITTLGYASTLVLQHRLEISFRQASSILADLERDGLIGPAHGFRPHKALRPAYQVLEKIERGSKTQNK
ncbi:MAG TPA: DNA translocase FtsK [Blastocatellia bacterium]|jgi:DNA segregation ATPase FtsK/SpoIIIE-like protein